MGDAAGELADRVHFLGLSQLLLERAPLRHVLRDRLEAVDRAVRSPHCTAGESDEDLCAVTASPCHFTPLHPALDREAPEDTPTPARGRVYFCRGVGAPQPVPPRCCEPTDSR